MEGIYKIQKDKIDQYSAALYTRTAKIFGIIMLLMLTVLLINNDKDNWNEFQAWLIVSFFMVLLVLGGYLFVKPDTLTIVIEIKKDRIIRFWNGFEVEIKYEDMGRFVERTTGTLILRKGISGERNYWTSKRFKATDKNMIFIPSAIENYSKICTFLKNKQSE